MDQVFFRPVIVGLVILALARIWPVPPPMARAASPAELPRQTHFDEALAEAKQALSVARQLLGPRHPDLARPLNQLAEAHIARGDHSEAELLLREALLLVRDREAEGRLAHAATLSNLARLHLENADYTQAEPLLRRAVELLGGSTPGDGSSDAEILARRRALQDLGLLLISTGNHHEAEAHLRQAVETANRLPGDQLLARSGSLQALATLHLARSDAAEAEPLLRQARALRVKALGDRHPEVATGLYRLAQVHLLRGDGRAAEPLAQEALTILQRSAGDHHPLAAWGHYQLGWCRFQNGDMTQARQDWRTAIDITGRNLEWSCAGSSAGQALAQFQLLRACVDAYLSLPAVDPELDTEAFDVVARMQTAAWKRPRWQFWIDFFANLDGEMVRLSGEWKQVSRRLAALAAVVPPTEHLDSWRTDFRQTEQHWEELAARLTKLDAHFAWKKGLGSLSHGDIQAALPPATVLVDCVEYVHGPPAGRGEKSPSRLAAFVIRPGRRVVRLDLGPSAPIRELIQQWRSEAARPAPTLTALASRAAELRRLVWRPLEPHLDGVRAVLVSPDPAVGVPPFAALPGRAEGSYLIEEIAVGLLPVGLRYAAGSRDAHLPAAENVLLLIGNIDLQAAVPPPGPRQMLALINAQRGSSDPPLQLLPDAAGEMNAVADLFGQWQKFPRVSRLEGAAATRSAVQDVASNKGCVYVAAPIFEANQKMPATVPLPSGPLPPLPGGPDVILGYRPTLLTGLAMAGAGRPREPAAVPPQVVDDGILTLRDIARLDLEETRLAVLATADEKLLAAFQAAGARTVVARLGRDSGGTQVLQQFLTNRWQRRLGPLEALRQAQLHALQAPGGRERPWEWAAWVVSGDPGEPAGLVAAAGPASLHAARPDPPGWLAWLAIAALLALGLLVWFYQQRRARRI